MVYLKSEVHHDNGCSGAQATRPLLKHAATFESLLDNPDPPMALDKAAFFRSSTAPSLAESESGATGGRTFPEIRTTHYTFKRNCFKASTSNAEPTDEGFRLLRNRSSRKQEKLQIHRIHHLKTCYSLYLADIFHTLVDMPLWMLMIIIAMVYLVAFSVLSWLFWSINDSCELGMESPWEAFALSVETWLTIGYGLPDSPGPYLRNCPVGVVIVTAQGVLGLMLNAFLVGLVLTHTSSGVSRASTLMFSQNAVVREVSGRLYLLIQVCEMRSTQLLEAHMRAYVLRHPASSSEGPVDGPQLFEMRLSRPDDSNGGMVLPVLPTILTHEIDQCSPLAPPPARDDALRSRHWTRPLVRDCDAVTGGRAAVWCRVCGEQFPTQEMLEAHMEYQAEQDQLAGAVIRPHHSPHVANSGGAPTASGTPQELLRQRSASLSAMGTTSASPSTTAEKQTMLRAMPEIPQAPGPRSWRQRVVTAMESQWFEVLVILEGVDGTTGGPVQARHSYINGDIVWDHSFSSILEVDPEQKYAAIDYTKIHDLVPALPE